MRRLFFLGLLLLLVACSKTSSKESVDVTTDPQARVEATGFLFQPSEVEITPGGAVLFTNRDRILHTVTSGTADEPDDFFDRRLDGEETTARITFDTPGVYPFFCSRHPHMTGVVSVKGTR